MLAPRQLTPRRQYRDLAPDWVSVELVAALEEKMKGLPTMLLRQIQPQSVALIEVRPSVAMLNAVAGREG
jgi:hypothetical protein